jgi:hypothetical protein
MFFRGCSSCVHDPTSMFAGMWGVFWVVSVTRELPCNREKGKQEFATLQYLIAM